MTASDASDTNPATDDESPLAAPVTAPPPDPVLEAPAAEEPTVGTGSAVAIGCLVATVGIMVLGILLVLWLR